MNFLKLLFGTFTVSALMFLCYCIYQKKKKNPCVIDAVMQAPSKECSANAVFLHQPFHSAAYAGFIFS